ncbi:uncharacterized protein RAG0_06655 [Rhynchosporium agropyri]|uniref:Uncharacterized protein n=1 Tax=Rhynchosporium agropyri TaxID=914238 RepID=A0A1E1KI34_9HELO|nr:uncharacterized protein RAG0_06655 [Rhynchosporium agropyri]
MAYCNALIFGCRQYTQISRYSYQNLEKRSRYMLLYAFF